MNINNGADDAGNGSGVTPADDTRAPGSISDMNGGEKSPAVENVASRSGSGPSGAASAVKEDFGENGKPKFDIGLSNFFNLKTGEVNVKSLDPCEIDDYLRGIYFLCGRLRELFSNSKKYSFQVPLEDAFDTKADFGMFLDKLLFFFDALKCKFAMQSKGINPTSLSIDPTESGFPHLTDLWNLKNDIAQAESQLAAIPPVSEIVSKAVDSMFQGEFPVREQLLYARQKYFSFLKGKDFVSDFGFERPVLLGGNDSEKLVKLNFYGFDELLNIFHFYSTLVTLSKASFDYISPTLPGGENYFATIRTYYKKDLFQLANCLDSVDPKIHPKVIIKHTIGPYYSKKTINEQPIQNLLDMQSGDDPFVFKFKISGTLSVKTLKENSLVKKFVNSLFGYANSQEVFAEKFVYDYMLVPFKVKQYLKSVDETGKPCKVFGLLDGGDIIE